MASRFTHLIYSSRILNIIIITLASRDGEHIKAPHGDLDQENSTTLEIGEEYFHHCICHHDDAEQDRERAGQNSQAEIGVVQHLGEGVDLTEFFHDLLPHLTDAGAVARDPGGKGALQRDGERIKADWGNCEKGYRQKAFDDTQRSLLEIPPSSADIHDTELKARDNDAHTEQCPGQTGEKQDNGLDPG